MEARPPRPFAEGSPAASTAGRVEVGQADPVALRLARAYEARQLGLAILGVEHDDVVARACSTERSQGSARGLQVALLAPHPLQARAVVVAQERLPGLAFDAFAMPVELEQDVRVEVRVDLVEVDRNRLP